MRVLKMCKVKMDLSNAIVMKCRCIYLVCKFSVKTLPTEVCALARRILEQNVKSIINEMKESECKRWTQLWLACRNLVYNVGILFEHVYEESVRLFSFWGTCIFHLKEIESNFTEFKILNTEFHEHCRKYYFLCVVLQIKRCVLQQQHV